MVAGQYTVIIQHPMGNGEFDIWPDGMRNLVMGNTPWPNSPIFRIGGAGSLNGPEAANALITALNSAFIDDTYTMYNIRVDSPKIMVDESSFIQDGSGSIVISGTTNLAAGTRLLIEITDNRFIPTRKSDRDSSYGYSGTAEIWQGDSSRFFTFTVPSGRLEAGEYRLIVQAVESEAMTTELLTIITEPVSRLDIPAVGNQTTNTTLPELPNVSGMITPAGYQNETNLTTSPSPLETIVNPDESGKPTVKPEQLTVMPTVSEGEKAVYQSLSPVLLILLGVTLGIIIAGIVAFILSKRAKADMEPVEEPISDNTVDDENTKTADELTRSDKGDDISNSELPANERDN
jgi:hypothetical protein